MSFDEFLRSVEQIRASYPAWFSLAVPDPIATDVELAAAEELLCVRLPDGYRTFVKTFGGGDFALGNVFSVTTGSYWNIADQNASARIPSFIAVSDSGAGDLYGFGVVDGFCSEDIFFWDHETPAERPVASYSNLYDFLRQTALTIGGLPEELGGGA